MGHQVKVAPNGRVVIPLDVRVELGLEEGGTLFLERRDQEIVLQTRLARVREAQRMAAEMLVGYEGDPLDDFLADRAQQREREYERAQAQDTERHGV